jgi:hypothetical protein
MRGSSGARTRERDRSPRFLRSATPRHLRRGGRGRKVRPERRHLAGTLLQVRHQSLHARRWSNPGGLRAASLDLELLLLLLMLLLLLLLLLSKSQRRSCGSELLLEPELAALCRSEVALESTSVLLELLDPLFSCCSCCFRKAVVRSRGFYPGPPFPDLRPSSSPSGTPPSLA